ncbi:hypothetical protein E8E14_005493 [Neopestalotiopsis sp. 37M]|nr:hypothetical protein E8E14_005493 [Neopestalotiopsis sp. 37M]
MDVPTTVVCRGDGKAEFQLHTPVCGTMESKVSVQDEFLALANTAIEIKNKVQTRIAEAPKELGQLLQAIWSLFVILSELRNHTGEPTLTDTQKTTIQKIQANCRDVLADTEHALNKDSSSLSIAKSDDESIIFEEPKISEREIFSREITELRERVSSITSALDAAITEPNREILEWLVPNEHNTTMQSEYFSKRATGTYQWFLDSPDYQTWSSTKGKIFFCHGGLGVGKSVLASTVIASLQESYISTTGVAVCYFYFSDKVAWKKTFDHVMLAMIWQLVRYMSAIPKPIVDIFKRHQTVGGRPSSDEVRGAFCTVASTVSRLFIVIDAVNDYRSSADCHEDNLSTLLSLQAEVGANLFLTSRAIPHIAEPFLGHRWTIFRASDDDIAQSVRQIVRAANGVLFLDDGSKVEASCQALFSAKQNEDDHEYSQKTPEYPWSIYLIEVFGLAQYAKGPERSWQDEVLDRAISWDDPWQDIVFDIASTKSDRHMALSSSVKKNRETIVEWLLENGAKAECQYNNPDTPLAYAAKHGQVEIVRLLLDRKLVVDPEDIDENVALLHAAARKHESVVKLLLEHGKNLKKRRKGSLGMAAFQGNDALVRFLLEKLARAQLPDNIRNLVIVYASEREHHDIVQLLSKPDYWNTYMLEMLQSLVQEDRSKDILSLLQLDPIILPSADVYRWAVTNQQPDVILSLLERGPRERFGEVSWENILLAAIDNGNIVLTHMILNSSPQIIYWRDDRGRTVLFYACDFGKEDIVKALLDEHKADVNAQCKLGRTPLISAAYNEMNDVVAILLSHEGIEVDKTDNLGRDVLSIASQTGKYLEHRGAPDDVATRIRIQSCVNQRSPRVDIYVG